MRQFYVESTPMFELEDMVDEILYSSETVFDKTRKCHYFKIGCGFDIETSKIPCKNGEYISYCYHWQFGFDDMCIMGRSLRTMEDFFKMMCDHIEYIGINSKKNIQLLILDANLGYEFAFCKHYWKHLGITDLFAKEKRDPIYITVGKSLCFREVLGLWGHSLAQIATNHCGIEKLVGDLDYDIIRTTSTEMTEAEIGYCVRDVEILVILGRKIFDRYYGKNSRMPYTSTGIVRDEIKKEFGSQLKSWRKKIESWMPTKEEYEDFRTMLFKGGISGSNIIHMDKVHTNVVGADITSDYPFQMLTKKFPMGAATKCNNSEFMKEDKPYIAQIRFHKFKSRNNHALMSAHKAINKEELKEDGETVLDNNRIQYGNSVELLLNDVEFEALKKAYKWEHSYVVKCWVFNDGYELLPIEIRRTVIRWYLKKESLKKEHSDTQEYRDAKAFVNAIFGMMCTALYLEEYAFIEDICDIDVPEFGMKDYAECCKYLFLSPYWGFWITSYAREMLMDVICRFPRVIIQYDTDSVYFMDDGSEQAIGLRKYLENFNRITSNKNYIRFVREERLLSLGTWDFTEQFKRFKALGSKRYIYEDSKGNIKCVVAGCRKSKKFMKENGKTVPYDPIKIKNKQAYEVSTIVLQNEYNNEVNGTNVDVFDFFSDKMYIDENHSEKLCSKYIDEYCIVNYNGEMLEIPSCIVLEPIAFKMGLGLKHKDLLTAIKRYMRNTNDWSVYDIWRKAQKLKSAT
jgi:hypothetical protein